jgi:OmpR-family two-component system manganese-sensing response regulator
MQILLAEDDQAVSLITSISLEKIGGHQVTVVEDGEAAVDLATRQAFDLIILDGMMPKKSGLQAAQEIRGAGLVTTPIIFLSAKSDERDIREFLELGVGYIAKPFEPTQICAHIDEILVRTGFKR